MRGLFYAFDYRVACGYKQAMRTRSFRIVAPGTLRPQVEDLLRMQGYAFEPEPFAPFCYRLLEEPRPLGSSLAAFFGYVYIQDRSSMLPPLALAPRVGSAVLDMCASPGSKTSLLAQLVGSSGFVLGNEANPTRLGTLRANLRQMNLVQVGTTCQQGEQLPLAPATWENIQLDPPCSGWGTADKHPKVMQLWQAEKCQPLIALQQALLRKAASLLVPGGRLVYSTCTTHEAENEAQVRFAEEECGLVREPLAAFPSFSFEERPGGEGTLRVDGEQSAAQGFYIALLRKPAQSVETGSFADEDTHEERAGKGREIAREKLADPCFDPKRLPPGRVALFGDAVRFVPEGAQGLRLSWQGALLGKLPGGNFSPDTRLRCCLPTPGEAPEHALVLDDIADISALLAGQSRQTGLSGRQVGLWWRDLPLGILALKQGRALASFK